MKKGIRISPEAVHPHPYPWQSPVWSSSAADNSRHLEALIGEVAFNRRPALRNLHRHLGSLKPQVEKASVFYGKRRAVGLQARLHAFDVIRDLFTGVKSVEEDEKTIIQELPLCVFNAPAFPGAKTTYAVEKSTDVTAGWSIEVLGSGYGSDVTVSVSQSSKFTASAGTRKLVFAPLHIRVVRVALYKWGQFQRRFLRAELSEPKVRDANGIATVTEAQWKRLVGAGRPLEEFDLSSDASTDIATYSFGMALSGTFETSIGLSAFGLKTKVTAKCSAKQKAEATFELPPGHRYRLRSPRGVAGFYFNC